MIQFSQQEFTDEKIQQFTLCSNCWKMCIRDRNKPVHTLIETRISYTQILFYKTQINELRCYTFQYIYKAVL